MARSSLAVDASAGAIGTAGAELALPGRTAYRGETTLQDVRQFSGMIKKGEAARLDQWLEDCKASGIFMLQTFAARIRQDYDAVRAALETKWSNGKTKDQFNRLKLLKRQMYGRGNFDLLRQRVLYAA